MKKMNFFVVLLLMTAAMLTSCGGSKNVAQNSRSSSTKPFGDTSPMPCEIYDTPQDFAATGIYMGSYKQKGKVQLFALANAKQIVKIKVQQACKGLLSEYASTLGNNKGNDIEDSMEMACDNAIDVLLNETNASCIRWSDVLNDGDVECYVAIKISKQDLSSRMAQAVDNKLTKDEKMLIKFHEQEFRDKMDDRLKKFEETQK